MLQDHYNITFTVKRKQVTGRKTTFATAGSGLRGHKQPARAEYQLQSAGNYDKAYVLLCDFNVEIGDTIIADKVTYSVHGVDVHNFRGGRRHTEVHMHTSGEVVD